MSRVTLPDGFDWFKVLAKAKEDSGSVSREMWSDLMIYAQGWPTCACGQLCAELPRNDEGCPLDSILRDLGLLFNEQIRSRTWCWAFETLERIECRTNILLQEQEAKACILS